MCWQSLLMNMLGIVSTFCEFSAMLLIKVVIMYIFWHLYCKLLSG